MKKYLLWALIIDLLALDWMALDDITTGNEPSYVGEWIVILLSIPLLGLVLRRLLLRKKVSKTK